MTHSHSPEFPQDLGVYERAFPIPEEGFFQDQGSEELVRHLRLVPDHVPEPELKPTPQKNQYVIPEPFDQRAVAETSSGLPNLGGLEKYYENTGRGFVVGSKYEIQGNLKEEKKKADAMREASLLEPATEAVAGLADGSNAISKETDDAVGFGVYRARDLTTGELVTVKIGPEHGIFKDLSTVELEILKALKNEDKTHPNLSNLIDHGFSHTPDGQIFEFGVSEYAKDGTLADLEDLSTEELIEVTRQLTSAVSWLNELGIVNLDLSVNNVGINRNEDGQIETKIIDIESARPESNDPAEFKFAVSEKLGKAVQNLIDGSVLVATPHYVSPEVRNPETATLDETMSAKIDSYSMSVLLEKIIINFHDPNKFNEIPGWLTKIIGGIIEEDKPSKRKSAREIKDEVGQLALAY